VTDGKFEYCTVRSVTSNGIWQDAFS